MLELVPGKVAHRLTVIEGMARDLQPLVLFKESGIVCISGLRRMGYGWLVQSFHSSRNRTIVLLC